MSSLGDIDLQKIMESGQCFRITKESYGYRVASGSALLVCSRVGSIDLMVNSDIDYWKSYFNTSVNFAQLEKDFIWERPHDDYLDRAVHFGHGLAVLNQNPFETLISFIISQRKSIKAISSCIEELCEKFGTKVADDFYAFPTPEQLVNADLDQVSGLGYRREYVRQAAKRVYDGYSLKALKDLPYERALSELKTFYGVGDKVANCVLLYSLGFKSAFPVDVWIQRILDTHYNGNNPFKSFDYAGYLQLYLFYYERYGEGGGR